MTESELLSLLRNGVMRSRDLMARITDYHGGPITTEYLLTSDVARALIEEGYQVEVEYLNRKLVNGLTIRRGSAARGFGSKRTDVAVLYNDLVPLAMIELKIGVKTLKAVEGDLAKITDTIDALKPQYASRVWGAAVFQVHISGSNNRDEEDHFRASITQTENTIKSGLKDHAKVYTGYDFRFCSLQSKNEGYAARIIEPDGDGFALGQHGHATRYYAVLIKSKIGKPKPSRTLAERRAYEQS